VGQPVATAAQRRDGAVSRAGAVVVVDVFEVDLGAADGVP
jgi:hypothetical protein